MTNTKFKTVLVAFVSFFWFTSQTNAQFDNIENNRLKLEMEPALFIGNGRSLNAFYNVTKNNNLSLGFYLASTDIPLDFIGKIFSNVANGTTARLSQEYALNVRYRFKMSKKYESNPYIGFLCGWENLRLFAPGEPELNIGTFIATPHVGYEFFVYKKMLYLNPQFRSAFYFGATDDDNTGLRKEKLKSYLLLPSISVGVRL